MSRFFLTAAVLSMLFSAASCSIREDRSECPCTVSVKTQTDSNCVVSFYEGTELIERKGMGADVLCNGENYTYVRRGLISVSAVNGTSSLEYTDSSIRCRPGQQFGEVCAFFRDVSTECESVLVNGALCKQYCMVKLYVRNAVSGEYPYRALFKAPCDGMLLPSLAPASGQFIYEPMFGADNGCTVRLPRQRNSDIICLQMMHASGRTAKVDLGKYFFAAAYDWEAESLDDITIVIDFSMSTLTIRVDDWTQVFVYKEI